MAFWDNWFGGHDAEVNPYGWKRRRFFDNIHSGFLATGSKRRGERAEFSDFARNALSNAGLLGLSGFLSGGWSMPAFLVGAKSFMTFNTGLSSIKGHLRAAALMDHALGGTYFDQLEKSKARLTPEAQRLIAGIFGRTGAIDTRIVRDLIQNDSAGTRALLNRAFKDGIVNPAGRTKFLSNHEKSELSSIFGLGFLDHWSRTRLHPAIDGFVGNRLSTGVTAQKSFYQSLSSMSKTDLESLYDNAIAGNANLTETERKYLHNILIGQREADSGSVKSFHQILGGAFGVGLASAVEGNLGNTAAIKNQAAAHDNLVQMVKNHQQYLESMPEHLKVVVDTKTGLAMVNDKLALQYIVGRGAGDPILGPVGAGMKGTTTFSDSAYIPQHLIDQNMGGLVQGIISKHIMNPFVQDVAAHLDFGAIPALVHQNAAIAAAGGGIHPGWAIILGALTDPTRPYRPQVPLPPGKGKKGKGSMKEGEDVPAPSAGIKPGTAPGAPVAPLSKLDALLDALTVPGGPSAPRDLYGAMRLPPRRGKGRPWEGPAGRGKGRTLEDDYLRVRQRKGVYAGDALRGSASDESGRIRMALPKRGGKGRVLDDEPVRRGKGQYWKGGRGGAMEDEPAGIFNEGEHPDLFGEGEGQFRAENEGHFSGEGEGFFRGHANQLGHDGQLLGEGNLWNQLMGVHSSGSVRSPFGRAARKLSPEQWKAMDLEEIMPEGRVAVADPLPPEKALELKAPAPISNPLTPHISSLEKILSHHEFTESSKARELIGRELDRSGFFKFGENPFGLDEWYAEGHRSFQQTLGNVQIFSKVVEKLRDPTLTEEQAGHLHSALVRGILHHAQGDVRRRNVLASEFNDLSAQGQIEFRQGALKKAHEEVQQAVKAEGGNINAVHETLTSREGEWSHAIASIHPRSDALFNRSHVHGQLIGRLHQLYRG